MQSILKVSKLFVIIFILKFILINDILCIESKVTKDKSNSIIKHIGEGNLNKHSNTSYFKNNIENSIDKNINLSQYLSYVTNHNDLISEKKHLIEEYKSYQLRVKYAIYPKINFKLLAGIQSSNYFDQSKKYSGVSMPNLLYNSFVELSMPIYGFGKRYSAYKAIDGGIEYAKNTLLDTKFDIAFKAKEVYYGYLLASTIKDDIIKYAKETLVLAIKEAKEIYNDDGDVTESDLNKLELAFLELKKKESYINSLIVITKDSLTKFMNLPSNTKISMQEKYITTQGLNNKFNTIKNVDNIGKFAALHNTKLKMLLSGIKAKKGLTDLKSSHYYPYLDTKLLVGVNNDKLSSKAFYYNKMLYNKNYDFNVSLFVGLNWGLDLTKEFESALENSQYKQLIDKKNLYLKYLAINSNKLLSELNVLEKSLTDNKKAFEISSKWITSSAISFTTGLGSAKDILEGVKALIESKTKYYKNIYNYNMKLAEITSLLGYEVTSLNY